MLFYYLVLVMFYKQFYFVKLETWVVLDQYVVFSLVLLNNLCYYFRTVSIATITAEKPTATVVCSNKWQAPVIKGRFSKSVWLGNPSEPTPPLLPIVAKK